jgi:hypothetical protein
MSHFSTPAAICVDNCSIEDYNKENRCSDEVIGKAVKNRCCQATVSRYECRCHPKGEGGRRETASQETCLLKTEPALTGSVLTKGWIVLKRTAFLLVSLFLLYNYICCSSIYVYDASDTSRVSFVVVSFKSREMQVMTPFEADSGLVLKIKCLAYEDAEIFVGADSSYSVFLIPKPFSAKGTTVFSEEVRNIIRETDVKGGIKNGLANLSPYLHIKEYNRSLSVSLPGMSQEDILFSVDGVPIINQASRIIDLSLISVAAVGEISLSRNSSSSLRGENIFGGAVDIKTAKNTILSLNATASINSAEMSVNMDAGMLSGGFFRSEFNNMIMPKGIILENSDKSAFGFNLNFDAGENDILVLYGTSESGDPGISGYRYENSRVGNSLLVINQKMALGERMSITNSVTSTSYTYFNEEINPVADDLTKTSSLLTSLSCFNDNILLSVSNQLNRCEGTKTGNVLEEYPSLNASLKKGLWNIEGSAGFSISNKTAFVYSANVTTEASVLKEKILAGLRTSVRRPTFNELYWAGDAFARGNANLESEKMMGFFLFADREFTRAEMRAEAGLNYFLSMIRWVNEGGIYTPENVLFAVNPHISIDAKIKFDNLEIGNVFLFSPNYTEKMKLVPYSPVFKDNLSVKVIRRFVFLQLSADYQSPSYISQANTKSLERSFLFSEASIGARFGRSEIKLSITNPLDQNVESVNGYYLEGRKITLSMEIKL